MGPQNVWPVLDWYHHDPCHWNQPPGTNPRFSLPSFLCPIMLFHGHGFTPSKGSSCLERLFPFFKELISTCPLIINQDSSTPEVLIDVSVSYRRLLLVLHPHISVILSLNHYLASLPPNDYQPLDVWFYFLFISSSQLCAWHVEDIFQMFTE